MRSTKRNWAFKVRKWVLLGLSLSVPVFACSVPLLCQQTPVVAELGTNPVMLQETASPTVGQKADGQTPGNIRGRVVDQSGANITGAIVTLTREGQSSSQEVESDEEGQFFFFNIDPGAFQLTITSEGLASQTVSGSVKAGETCVVPQVTSVVATQVTEVRVGLPPAELAELQIEDQEKQRAFGFVPNFYVSYVGDAAPLSPRLKFRLAWKSASDPVTLAGVGFLAGIDQAADRRGAASVVSTALIRLGETSLAAILQELVFPRFSPKRSARGQSQP